MDFPLEFVERTRLLLGDEEWKKLEAALAGEPSVSIRVNRKNTVERLPMLCLCPGAGTDIICLRVRPLLLTRCCMQDAIMCRKRLRCFSTRCSANT